MLAYVLDAEARILEIEGEWDEFARVNGAPELEAQRVVGQPLPAFVAGQEMKELTRLLIERARALQRLAIDFRCDSPGERRYLRMDLESIPRDRVRCATTVVRTEPRTALRLIDRCVLRNGEVLVICSWCNKVQLPAGAWAEVEHAVELLYLFEEGPMPQLSHGICPPCRQRLTEPA